MDDREHRRAFLKQSAALAVGGGLLSNQWARASAQQPAQKKYPGGVQVRVRPDVSTLDPSGPELQALRQGIAAMKAASDADPMAPTGWTGQARIHLDECPHGNWFFLPWHRAYIYFFEEICRIASGDSNFMLPYWDWTANPALPEAFWGDASNPLFHPGRWIVQGEEIGPEFVGQAVIDSIMGNADFISAIGSSPAPAPRPLSGAQSTLEGTPHNNVHCVVGGDMCSYWSPLDPIFWLHHGNIDRLWTMWDLEHPGSFPADPAFRGFNMNVFFDVNGNPAGRTVEQILSTHALGYRYPEQPAEPPAARVAAEASPLREIPADLRAAASVQEALAPDKVIQVELTPSEELGGRLAALARSEVRDDPTVRLQVGPFEGEINPGYFVRVFLNHDELTPDTPIDDPHYVGSFGFFLHHGNEAGGHAPGGQAEGGHAPGEEHGARAFFLDASNTVGALGAAEQFRGEGPLRIGLVIKERTRQQPVEALADRPPPQLNPQEVQLEFVGPGTR